MPSETSEVLDLLNGKADEVEPFKEAVVPSPEDEPEKDDKPLPFHEDPKVQRYVQKQIEKALKERPSEEKKFRQEVQDEIDLPPALVKLVGNDTEEKREALSALAKHLDSLTDRAKDKFIEEMRQQEREQAAKDKAVLDELNAGFDAIEEQSGIDLHADKKQRDAFLEYLRKVSHKNADGEVDQFADIPATWETFQERQKPSPSRAKELASRGLTRSNDTTPAAPQGRSWKDVERFFDKLKDTN